ncbi:MAG TPA: uroporphyrinogen-III synthase [Terracidiphilus sp.]|nr:uroporphyrinogen-III synthase [Terracidiphilus sp.]
MTSGSFKGMRVLALESRRSAEIAKLIRSHDGEPMVAPAMREVPLESNTEALEFARHLIGGEYDLVIFLTGVGVRRLTEIIESRYDRAVYLEALRRVKVASRGPKVSAALREIGVPIAVSAPEPCTWREVIGSLDGAFGASLKGMRAAVQEYGTSNPELLEELTKRQVRWTRVPVYHWELPEDLEPLRNSIRAIAAGKVDVIVFLTAMQVAHLFEIAAEMGAENAMREGMHRVVLLSIGPSTTEELARHGMRPDFEPSHPKMGILVSEAAARAAELLVAKRGKRSDSAS